MAMQEVQGGHGDEQLVMRRNSLGTTACNSSSWCWALPSFNSRKILRARQGERDKSGITRLGWSFLLRTAFGNGETETQVSTERCLPRRDTATNCCHGCMHGEFGGESGLTWCRGSPHAFSLSFPPPFPSFLFSTLSLSPFWRFQNPGGGRRGFWHPRFADPCCVGPISFTDPKRVEANVSGRSGIQPELIAMLGWPGANIDTGSGSSSETIHVRSAWPWLTRS